MEDTIKLISCWHVGLAMSDKPTMDLLDMFAGYALSGYAREGVSYASRDDECKEVSRACYDLAFAMVKTRQDILDERELQITKKSLQDTTK